MNAVMQFELLEAPLGATPQTNGVTFRVWAPNADGVAVIGDFNDWNAKTHPMTAHGDGTWGRHVREAVPGSEYRYLVRRGKDELARIDPHARAVTSSVGNAVVYEDRFDWRGDAFRLPALNELVIYELHVGTFAADAGGKAGAVGSFAGTIAKLDHLAALGVNCIELMPVAEFAGDLSWGYNPAHPFAVESAYGGPDSLKELVREAHARGIGVILDVVYNHFGPSDLDLWRFDGWGEGDGGGVYFYNDWRAETPWGKTRPDYGRGEVRQYLRDNALYWLREFHIDGLRFDMTLYMRHVNGSGDPGQSIPEGWSLTSWINDEVRREFPECITIAEDLRDEAALTRPTDQGGAGFHAQWDANFVHPVRAALTCADDAGRDLEAVIRALLYNYNGDVFQRVIYTESHDEVANGKARIPTEVMPHATDDWFAVKRAMLGSALALTAPGIPMLFQGQEFLEDRWFQDNEPLRWSKAEKFAGALQLHRDLIALRLNRGHRSLGLTGQNTDILACDHMGKTLAYHRWRDRGPGDSVVVLLNFHSEPRHMDVTLPDEGPWRLVLNSDAKIYDVRFADTSAPAQISGDHVATHIGPYSTLIYCRET
jgi:1,4-alpha-glucan branching enzyme